MEFAVTPSYSLSYFEEIFGGRTDEFRELVGILLAGLAHYRDNYPRLVREGGSEEWHRFRHKHITLLENLQLVELKQLQQQIEVLTLPPDREANITKTLALVEALISALESEIKALPVTSSRAPVRAFPRLLRPFRDG